MRPYYQHGGITIYHGDCMEVLPLLIDVEGKNSVDCVITDPPYGIGQADWDKAVPMEWFGLAQPLISHRGSAYIFGNPITLSRFQVCWEQQGVKWSARTTWVYESGGRHRNSWTCKHEDCLFFKMSDHELEIPSEPSKCKDKRWGDDRIMGDVWSIPRIMANFGERVDHPTQKPLELMHIPIRASTTRGALILDPFMGSGTTLRAAKDLHRKAIGIELEERYCELAARRMSQEVFQF